MDRGGVASAAAETRHPITLGMRGCPVTAVAGAVGRAVAVVFAISRGHVGRAANDPLPRRRRGPSSLLESSNFLLDATAFSPQEASTTERLFCGVQLALASDGQSIRHTNFFVPRSREDDDDDDNGSGESTSCVPPLLMVSSRGPSHSP